MRSVHVGLVILPAIASCEAAQKGNSVVIRSAPRVQFPRVVAGISDWEIVCARPDE